MTMQKQSRFYWASRFKKAAVVSTYAFFLLVLTLKAQSVGYFERCNMLIVWKVIKKEKVSTYWGQSKVVCLQYYYLAVSANLHTLTAGDILTDLLSQNVLCELWN